MNIRLNKSLRESGTLLLVIVVVLLTIIIVGTIVWKILKTLPRLVPFRPEEIVEMNQWTSTAGNEILQMTSVNADWSGGTLSDGTIVQREGTAENVPANLIFSLIYTLMPNGDTCIFSCAIGEKMVYSMSEETFTNLNLTLSIYPPSVTHSNGVEIFSEAPEARLTVVERTTNMVDWEPLFYNQISPGQVLNSMDNYAPADRGFYRVRSIQ
jgi:hypothetical protein